MKKAINCLRILRIAMGVVGGENDVLAAHGVDHVLDGDFIRLDGDHTVALKIFARRQGEIRGPNISFPFPSFI